MDILPKNEIGKFVTAEQGDYDLLKFNFAIIQPEELKKVRSLAGHIQSDVPELFMNASYGEIQAYMMVNKGTWEICELYITDVQGHEDMSKTNFVRMVSAKTGMEEVEVHGDDVHMYLD